MNIHVLKGQKGMIMVIVIAGIMLMSILVVGILSRSVSRSLGDEKTAQLLQAELLAKGGFWRAYQGAGAVPASFSETVGGRTYTISYIKNIGAGPSGTDEIITQVHY